MKSKKGGFALVELLLAIIAVSLVVFVGFYIVQNKNNTSDKVAKAKVASSAAKKAAADPTAGWKEFHSIDGKFRLKYPSSWATAPNQELCDSSTFLLGGNADSVGRCASDGTGQMMIFSFATESGELGLDPTYYTDIVTKEVTVDGVKGERQSGTYSYDGYGIGPATGSKDVVYIFKTNGLIYKAYYSQAPNYPDVLSDFDLLVTKTLKFN